MNDQATLENQTETKTATDDIDQPRILRDLRRAYDAKRNWLKEAEKDYLFALGKHWDDSTIEELTKRAVKPLTINKIKPAILLLAGIESQNRSDIECYPTGKEDSLKAEIATSLVKNAMMNGDGDFKVSEQWENGITIGECFMEPYMDFTEDILNGKMKYKVLGYDQGLKDPTSTEYDLSDAAFFIKLTYKLSKGELKGLFPKQADWIESLTGHGTIDLDMNSTPRDESGSTSKDPVQYARDTGQVDGIDSVDEIELDLAEYYYKKYVPRYVVIDRKKGTIKEVADKAEAENYIRMFGTDPETQKVVAQMKPRFVPEIWKKAIVGSHDKILMDERAETYPNWKLYPFIPYFAYYTSQPLKKNSELKVQGIVRGMRDLNYDLDKRATQELHHLNATANSGWLAPKDAWVDANKVRQFGSSPGVTLEYDPQVGKPERINPSPLSTGHHELTLQRYQDMKESSGINTDLLAVQEGGQSSGRAISLRQKQGLVMVQKLFDNLSRTKKILGRFILSQLREMYDVDGVARVMGEAWITDNFSVPVLAPQTDPVSGAPLIGPDQKPIMGPVAGPNGQMQMQVDQKAAVLMFNEVLNDSELGRFDISVGEGANTETVMYANYLQLMDMAKSGMPIPPEVLLEASTLPDGMKKKIQAAMQEAAAAAAQGAGGAPPQKKKAA